MRQHLTGVCPPRSQEIPWLTPTFSAAPAPTHAASSTPEAHPAANPGYGKRSAPDQLRRTGTDFAHLPHREAYIAGYIDRLPDGSDIPVHLLVDRDNDTVVVHSSPENGVYQYRRPYHYGATQGLRVAQSSPAGD
ncbi:hypothetical protein ACOKM5_18800 [Streptomyces sp. BH097]|uniref:hypothetical protein n=1 Tax=unclassified Streptomyces TaxID=2593676 RepID=UPI003BB5027E